MASSAAESVFCLESPSPNWVGFCLERVMRTRYRIDDFQQTYFVLEQLEDLLRLAEIDFGPLYERVAALPVLEPEVLLPGDEVLRRGDGRWRRARAVAD